MAIKGLHANIYTDALYRGIRARKPGDVLSGIDSFGDVAQIQIRHPMPRNFLAKLWSLSDELY